MLDSKPIDGRSFKDLVLFECCAKRCAGSTSSHSMMYPQPYDPYNSGFQREEADSDFAEFTEK